MAIDAVDSMRLGNFDEADKAISAEIDETIDKLYDLERSLELRRLSLAASYESRALLCLVTMRYKDAAACYKKAASTWPESQTEEKDRCLDAAKKWQFAHDNS